MPKLKRIKSPYMNSQKNSPQNEKIMTQKFEI